MRWVIMCILSMAANIQAQVHRAATPFSAMGDTDCAIFSPWSLFSNQAGISTVAVPCIGLSYRHIFDIRELNTGSLFAVYPMRWMNVGATCTYFGYEHYNEQLIGVAFGKRLAKFLDLGIKLDYLRSETAKQSGQRESLFFEAGILVSFLREVIFGLHIYNPANVARLTAPEQFAVPEKYTAGVSWDVDEMFRFAVQMESFVTETIFSAGVDIFYRKFLHMRGGFKSKYNNVSAGAGIVWNFFETDIGFYTHPYLGNVVNLCVNVKF